ncbi:hypothetical protein GCM10009765_81360 [Fodinicola feengrottensis]|uniref:Uncharacterized protein n=1 Tax=Fodinicola feengrottensis TaxID=435914 RepID=A0ABP4VCE9_9ACTN
MLSGEDYLSAVAIRASRNKGKLYTAPIGPINAMVANMYAGAGAALGQIHFCLVAATVPEINAFVVKDFSSHAAQHARQATNGVKGMGTLIVTLAGLVSPVVQPDAIPAATAKPELDFGAEKRPVVVDLSTGQVHMFTGTKFVGLVMQRAIRKRAQMLFPPPAEAEADLRDNPRPVIPPA